MGTQRNQQFLQVFYQTINKSVVRCHSFVREGKIEFLNDCTHEHAGQTLDLLDVDF
jgi:hypothetical protein